ncbi:GNAT family N-acetyltransferase [Nonomuraea phyllanthi]|uniref:GNAT family N-acetyltransferase n=1 Tax=Nonomuraea phyllanthi TaxID=2219224 RepID=UPI001292FB30|nr:GNAT family N-acetyltransferase [Nonomuraea phyllanthi]
MTADLVIRPISGPEEIGLFNTLPGPYNDVLAEDLGKGLCKPDWMWVALRGGHPVARVGWWSRNGTKPEVLETLDIDDTSDDPDLIDIAARLLRTAMDAVLPADTPSPKFALQPVPVRWREDPVAGRRIRERVEVVERTGGKLFVERLRYRWTIGTPLPEPPGRLAFRQVRDDEDAITLLARILPGTLDRYSQADISRSSIEEYAHEQYHQELLSYPSPRDWWRIGMDTDGEAVGMVVPARSPYGFVVAYIGVADDHRGHGYVDDLLIEGTRLLAAEGAERITADTDLANTPMAMAFDRTGYANFAGRIDMGWD